MKKMSQSELYALSRCSSSAFDLSSTENLVIPTINSDHHFPASISPTSPTRIFAFSHRRGRRRHRHRRRISASENDVADPQMAENRLILNSLQKLVAEREAYDSNPRNNDGGVRKRKRRRKSNVSEENGEEEFQGLGVIRVNGEEIDLKFLAGVAGGEFEAKLKKMTEGMVREDEFLGFLTGLEGRWGSSRKRRKYVAAADFLKALPANWKILLSLRPRARQPSLYCRRFVSPSDVHFKSCKDVAFYLKSEFVTNDANPPNEGVVMPIGNDHQATGPDLVAIAPVTSLAAEEVNMLETSELRNVPISSVSCPIVKNSLKHKSIVVKEELDPLQDMVTDHNESILSDTHRLKNSSLNGEGSPSVPESSSEPKNNSEVTRNLKTRCMWCLNEFSRPPVDAETLASSSGFICPKCKEEISGSLETTLSKFYQHADK